MKNFILVVLAFCFLEASCPSFLNQPPAEAQLQKACQFLWSQQSADGAWHSKTQEAMRGGEFLTAYLLYTLLQVPIWVYEPEEKQVKKALQFIRAKTNKQGILGITDPAFLDAPNQATAYALMILKEIDESKDSILIQKMTAYLSKEQFTEVRGFTTSQSAYGAWGLGEKHLQKGKTGYINLAHSSRILMALRHSENFASLAKKSRYFFRLTQKGPIENRLHATGISHKKIPYDGGFFNSPITLSLNMGGIAVDSMDAPYYFRSYATATCDGLLGLLASGYSQKDKPVQDALKWLLDHPKLIYPQGIPLDDPDQWHEVMFFYHLAVRAEVYAKLKIEGSWRDEIVSLLGKRQHRDGSFSNPMAGPNREDDTLMATGFAVSALWGVLL